MLDKNNLSVQTFFFTRNAPSVMFSSLAKTGIKKIEFYAGSPFLCHYHGWEFTKKEIADTLASLNAGAAGASVSFDCFAPELTEYPVNIAAAADELRAHSVDYYLDYLDDAVVLGSRRMLVSAGTGFFNEPVTFGWDRAVESLKTIAAKAQKLGVTLYLKPISPMISNLVNNLASLKRMVDDVGSDALKPCVDAAVMEENAETLAACFDVLGAFDYFRFGNFMQDGEIVEGKGLEQLRGYFCTLNEHGFEGTVVFEMNYEHLSDAPDALEKAVKNIVSVL